MIPRPLVPADASAQAVARGRPPWTFGPATVRLLLVGLLLVIPAWFDPRLLFALAAWDALVMAAWAIALARLPTPDALTVTRSWSAAPTVGTSQRMTLTVANHGAAALEIWIADYVNRTLRTTLPERTIIVPGGESARVEYDILPRARGDVDLSFVALRYQGGSGLAERWAQARLHQTIRVYPDVTAARREGFGLVRARHIAVAQRRGRAFGLGREFDRLRDFQDGDELRDVCWSATARRGRLVTRTYRPERNQTVWIVLDTGRLMRARDGAMTRLDRAANAAFALAQVAMNAGDRVALLAYGRGATHQVPPGRGAPHLRAILDALAVAAPHAAEADHARAAAILRTHQKRRALVVWLSDVGEIAVVPEVVESVAALSPAHVVLLAVTRPNELTALAAEVPADERALFRVTAAQEMTERRAELLASLRRRGVMAAEVPSTALTASVIDRYLDAKERGIV